MPSRGGGTLDRGLGADPFRFFQREMNRLFDDVLRGDFGMPALAGSGGEKGVLIPRVEMRETDNELRITAELPGVAEKDVEVSLDDDVLTIRGEKKFERTEERENTHFTERAFGVFQRSVRLPWHVEPDQVKANLTNGVLTITLPRPKEQDKTRKIPVIGSGSQAPEQGKAT